VSPLFALHADWDTERCKTHYGPSLRPAPMCETSGFAVSAGGNLCERSVPESALARGWWRGRPTYAPDVFHRPASRPITVDLVAVAARGVDGWAQLDQVFNYEPVFAEQTNPGPVGQLEGDGLPGLFERVQCPSSPARDTRPGGRSRRAKQCRVLACSSKTPAARWHAEDAPLPGPYDTDHQRSSLRGHRTRCRTTRRRAPSPPRWRVRAGSLQWPPLSRDARARVDARSCQAP
jgi:hypothetical protein